jgi:Protein of unknown function (DUF998)
MDKMLTNTTNTNTNPTTKALLAGGVVAGPLYLVVALGQALTRPGFDLLRHDVSLLSNGSLGWIQIANFWVSGLLVIAGAIGMWQALRPGTGKLWGPLLVGVYGLGLLGAGTFAADPAAGFPPGTPEVVTTISTNGLLHFVCGGLGFLSLIAGCFVFARRFAKAGERNWAIYSVVTGVIFFIGFAGIASGSGQSWSVIGLWIGVIVVWAWITIISVRLMNQLSATNG